MKAQKDEVIYKTSHSFIKLLLKKKMVHMGSCVYWPIRYFSNKIIPLKCLTHV